MSDGGIHLVGDPQAPFEGTIIATSVNHFEKGDHIVFRQHSGTTIQLDGEEYLVLHADDVLGVVK